MMHTDLIFTAAVNLRQTRGHPHHAPGLQCCVGTYGT